MQCSLTLTRYNYVIFYRRAVFATDAQGRSRRRSPRPTRNRPGHESRSRPRPVAREARSQSRKNGVSFAGFCSVSAVPSRRRETRSATELLCGIYQVGYRKGRITRRNFSRSGCRTVVILCLRVCLVCVFLLSVYHHRFRSPSFVQAT